MSTLQRGRTLMPDLLDWFDSPVMTLRPYFGQGMRLEDTLEEDRYIVRAELAGIDPDKDLEITIGSGYLTIRAERHDKTEGKHRSEFRYGSFTRSVSLPASADMEKASAGYEHGILTIIVPLTEEKTAVKKLPVSTGK